VTALRSIRRIAWAAIAGTLLVLGAGFALSSMGWIGPPILSSSKPAVGGPFELTSHKGETFNNVRVAGKPYLVFFGFTNCPEICPTTLLELTDLMTELGPAADRFTPLFVTVDPERDTQASLAEYMGAFDPRIVALRGTPEQTAAAVKSFAAYYRKVPLEGGGYTMDHTASVILMDAKGEFFGTLDIHEPRETSLAKLKRFLGA
jgi:protein SCO1/2